VRNELKANPIQRGFSLVSAIFLLVVLAGLGAMMVTFSTAQHQGMAMDVLGSRAYQAANAGVEWAAYNIETNPGVPGAVNLVPGTGTALGGNLAPFAVAVSYTAASATEGTDVVWAYDITSTASGLNGAVPGSADYVERVINVKMRE